MQEIHSASASGVTILAWVVAFLIFFPILWTFLTSFKSELDAIAMPPKFLFFNWTLENYVEVQAALELSAVRVQFDRAVDRREPRLVSSSPFRPPGRWRSRRASAPRTS